MSLIQAEDYRAAREEAEKWELGGIPLKDVIRILGTSMRSYQEDLLAVSDAVKTGTFRRWGPTRGLVDSIIVEVMEAFDVLHPSMPSSGLLDACKQVKQAAIGWQSVAEQQERIMQGWPDAFQI
jgi:hypothetical protein